MPGKQKDYFPLNLDMDSFYSYEDMSDFMRGLESPPSTPILYNFPPANSEDEDESTSSSVPGSDVDLDEMETLVIDIREKLRTTTGPSVVGTSGGVGSSAGSKYHSSKKMSNFSGSSSKCSRWRKNSSTNSSPSGHCCLNQINHSTIQKHGKAKWRHSKSLCELNTARVKDTYQILHELLESGSLIKEAVRRLKKTNGHHNSGNNIGASSNHMLNNAGSLSGANNMSSSNSMMGNSSSSMIGTNNNNNGVSSNSNNNGSSNVFGRKFWFQEDAENTYVHRMMD